VKIIHEIMKKRFLKQNCDIKRVRTIVLGLRILDDSMIYMKNLNKEFKPFILRK
jgi:hypothetical protein